MKIFNQIVQTINNIINNENIGYALTILDVEGKPIYFYRTSIYTPCSISFSQKKAHTAYSFNFRNDVIYSQISKVGNLNLLDNEYCFVPGGTPIMIENKQYYLGISTDDISLDTKIINHILNNL